MVILGNVRKLGDPKGEWPTPSP